MADANRTLRGGASRAILGVMRIASRVVALVALWSAASCTTGDGADPGSPLILIGIDGFRYDYLDSIPTPALDRLARDGVRAPLVPVFPTKTFPNFYTLVTGASAGLAR